MISIVVETRERGVHAPAGVTTNGPVSGSNTDRRVGEIMAQWVQSSVALESLKSKLESITSCSCFLENVFGLLAVC